MFILKNFYRFIVSILMKRFPIVASKIIYFRTFRKRLNLKKPSSFNEKLMWLKLFEDDSLKIKCADKYSVREYVSQCGYSNILVELLEVCEKFEDINFDVLPDKFVMKCTHGSGFNIICMDKNKINKEEVMKKLNKWMKTDFGLRACEPHYSQIKPRIIIEKFLEDGQSEKLPIDYMIHCFHGEPKIIEAGIENNFLDKREIMFDTDWNILPYNKASKEFKETIVKPNRFNEMLEIAKVLSARFTYVRVDLYHCNNKIYFGELTFTPVACLDQDFINNAELQMGELLDIGIVKKGNSSRVPILEYLKVK